MRPSVREVVAKYSLEDGSMELVLKLPANFPLGAIEVETGKKVGVNTSQWRKWMLQLTVFLEVNIQTCFEKKGNIFQLQNVLYMDGLYLSTFIPKEAESMN